MAEDKGKTVGIIGGMGPQATLDLMQRIIKLTPALDDKDHIHYIVDNNPKIPSRIKAIIDGDGEDPGPILADMARNLAAHGADVLAIACNTAHYYYDTVQAAVDIPVIHMIDAVLDDIRKNRPDCKRVGILASPAIKITGIYEERFAPAHIEIIFPDAGFQQQLFDVIRGVKAGKQTDLLHPAYANVCRHLAQKGAAVAIVACTELSALNSTSELDTIDAAQVLAQKIVTIARENN